MIAYYFVTPCDVLSPRGNHSFGSSGGEYGQALMPPRPSVFAGAFRSALAAAHPDSLPAIECGEAPSNPEVSTILGSAATPGTFRIALATLARSTGDAIAPLFAMPADIVPFEEDGKTTLRHLRPQEKKAGTCLSSFLPLVPFLQAPQKKPRSGLWLTEAGWRKTLVGEAPSPKELVCTSNCWKKELRLGIALDGQTRTAADGKLFTIDTISLQENTGFLIGIDGAGKALPEKGGLRLAGDGRGADYRRCSWEMPPAPTGKIELSKAFRVVMLTPGIFRNGWVPDGVELIDGMYRLRTKDFTARLACAAIPGTETISGWDLALGIPKIALRAVPGGSVYWFDQFEGKAEALDRWLKEGFWAEEQTVTHRSEGFNRAQLGVWLE